MPQTWIEKLDELGFYPSSILADYNLDLLEEYYTFLCRENERGGFFSRGDSERIADRHLFESASMVSHLARRLSVSRETFCLDIGSGCGLPGLLFAALHEPPHLTLLDSSRRRLSFLEEFLTGNDSSSSWPRVEFQYRRAEECRGNYPLIVLRAVAIFPFSLELATGMQRVGGKVAIAIASMPTIGAREEEYLQRVGYVPRETIELPEVARLGERRILLMEKMGLETKGYPRSWREIKKEIDRWE